MADGPDIGGHGIDVRGGQFAIHAGRDGVVMRYRPPDRLDAAVAPEKQAAGEVVARWRSLGVPAVTIAALSRRRLAVENAVAEQDLFLGVAGRHRQRIGWRPGGLCFGSHRPSRA